MQRFDFLVPEDASFQNYRGYIYVRGRDYGFRVIFPRNKSPNSPTHVKERKIRNAAFFCDQRLARVLEAYQDLLLKRLKQSSDLHSFLLELKDMIEHALTSASDKEGSVGSKLASAPASFSRRLLAELDEIGWGHVLKIDPSMTRLQLLVTDTHKRKHIVRVTLPLSWPSTPAKCCLDVPTTPSVADGKQFSAESKKTGDVSSENGSKRQTLATILAQCKNTLDRFHDFWRSMEDLDSQTCVLEPSNPSRASTRRRIAVKRHCSLQLDISAVRPLELCEVRFLGADAVTAPLVSRLNAHLYEWSSDRLPRENLEKILGIKFPSPRTSKPADFDMECGICYSYRLKTPESHVRKKARISRNGGDLKTEEEGVAPDRMCDNAKCGRPFHRNCLGEWLRSIPNTQQSFNTLFGKCPYCNSPITVDTSAV